jgi:hypothetical protein
MKAQRNHREGKIELTRLDRIALHWRCLWRDHHYGLALGRHLARSHAPVALCGFEQLMANQPGRNWTSLARRVSFFSARFLATIRTAVSG